MGVDLLVIIFGFYKVDVYVMSIILIVENSYRIFFVIVIRIVGVEWRNSRKRIIGI